jgi:hypothetical protein
VDFHVTTRRSPPSLEARFRVRIPMKSAGDSERKRPPEPIEASRALW